MIRHGQAASQFFIILDGTCSIWQPVRPQAMLKPLHRLRLKLQEAIREGVTELKGFSFRFHIEPFEIEADRRPMYCTYDDFKKLCSTDQGEEFTKFLWTQFQLHRAVDTVSKVDVKWEHGYEIKSIRRYLADFHPTQLLDDIVDNIHSKLNRRSDSPVNKKLSKSNLKNFSQSFSQLMLRHSSQNVAGETSTNHAKTTVINSHETPESPNSSSLLSCLSEEDSQASMSIVDTSQMEDSVSNSDQNV